MSSFAKKVITSVSFLASTTILACAPSGPHVHVASATATELQAAQKSDTVWYEFRRGDEVPFQIFVFGDAVSKGEPTKLVALKDFWLILSKNGVLRISYNGNTASSDQMEFILTVVPTEDGRAQVVWLNHIGTGSAKDALRELVGASQ